MLEKTQRLKPTIPPNILRQPVYYADPKTESRLPTQDELPYDDGVPMDTEQHRLQMELLINSLKPWLYQANKGYVSGNMFVYFSPTQVKNEDFKGPDVFVVLGVSNNVRKSWVVWEEGKAPDIVIELLSESTASKDKGQKKKVYQNQLKVPEYYWFDPYNPNDFQGFRLKNKIYTELPFKDNSFTSQSLGLKLTRWYGVYQNIETVWLRWTTLDGELLLLPDEAEAQHAAQEKQRADVAEQHAQAEAKRATQEKQRADAETQHAAQEKQRADIAEQRAQVEAQRAERLAQLLREQGIDPDKLS